MYGAAVTAGITAALQGFASLAPAALRDELTRIPAAVRRLVAASGVAAGPLGAAPLGLRAGGLPLLVLPHSA